MNACFVVEEDGRGFEELFRYLTHQSSLSAPSQGKTPELPSPNVLSPFQLPGVAESSLEMPTDQPPALEMPAGERGAAERAQQPNNPPPGQSDRQIAASRILRHAPEKLFGREPWLAELDRMWKQRDSQHVFTLVAWGGAGKTSFIAH
ncbi:hypothetical protein GC176_18650 [bacterium]|nr:hypothetical protein [bacterium]